jgi:hypothetical protein
MIDEPCFEQRNNEYYLYKTKGEDMTRRKLEENMLSEVYN